jgi:hypothetical protein
MKDVDAFDADYFPSIKGGGVEFSTDCGWLRMRADFQMDQFHLRLAKIVGTTGESPSLRRTICNWFISLAKN